MNGQFEIPTKSLVNKDSLKWIIGLTVFWPAIQLIIFLYRFGNLPADMLWQSLFFAPLGFFSALLLVNFQNRSQSRKQFMATTGGYALLTPVAFVASLMSGLVLPPLVGPLLYGIIPLALGVSGGYLIGKLFK